MRFSSSQNGVWADPPVRQGFVHASAGHSSSTAPTYPLPSFPLDSLRASPAEVAHILALPLTALTDPARHAIHYFRLDPRRPYWKVRVHDLVYRHGSDDETKASKLEAWGLSGWFLNCLAWRTGWLREPEAEMPEG